MALLPILCLSLVRLVAAELLQAEAPVQFEDFFVDKALRLELYQVGDAHEESVLLDHIYEEPLWPGNPRMLLQPFEAGRYVLKVYDVGSSRLIFGQGFDTTFAEYKTTTPALKGEKRVLQKSVRFPEPRKQVRVEFARRDKGNRLSVLYSTTVDPTDYHIIRETVDQGDWVFEIKKPGAA